MSFPRLESIYLYFQTLSLDIVLGACAGMLFFDRLVEADLNRLLYFLLASAVWCIYTFDHLLDARQIPREASTFRHAFHQKHFRELAFLMVLLASVGLGLAFYLLKIRDILIFGLILGGVILALFLLLKIIPRGSILIKELFIAMMYVGGIMLAPFFHNNLEKIPAYFWMLGLAYVLVAWFNTIYLGTLDRESDQKDGLYSLALTLGEARSEKILYILLAIMLVYIFLLYFVFNSYVYFHLSLILVIALIHGTSFLTGSREPDSIRRKLDASFMLPFVLLLT